MGRVSLALERRQHQARLVESRSRPTDAFPPVPSRESGFLQGEVDKSERRASGPVIGRIGPEITVEHFFGQALTVPFGPFLLIGGGPGARDWRRPRSR